MNYKQFEIYNVDLNPIKWSEQSWIRPCVILQTNAVSDLGKTTIIAIITSKKINKIYPYEVFLLHNKENGLKYDSKIKLDQIRVIDKSRILNKRWIINNKSTQDNILSSLDIIFDRKWYFRD